MQALEGLCERLGEDPTIPPRRLRVRCCHCPFLSSPCASRLQAQLGDSRLSPDVGYLLLHTLCPALYALVEDGLKPFQKDVITGQRKNSPWSVVEASVKTGRCEEHAPGDFGISISSACSPFPAWAGGGCAPRAGDSLCRVFLRPQHPLAPLPVLARGRAGPSQQHQTEVSCLHPRPFEVSIGPRRPRLSVLRWRVGAESQEL